MTTRRDIPGARAVGGIKTARGAGRWFFRTGLATWAPFPVSVESECACCRQHIPREPRVGYCRICVRHQRLYLVAISLVALSGFWLGIEARDWAFSLAPFGSWWLHGVMVFAISLAPPLAFQIVLNLWPSDPVHGHWGVAVRERVAGEGGHTVLFRNASYGRHAVERAGLEAREIAEPRAGWTAIVLLFLLVPGYFSGVAVCRFAEHFVTVHVDNGTSKAMSIEVQGGPVLGTAAAGEARSFRVPRGRMTLVAREQGALVESLTIGGLEDILAERYPELFPDIEYDVADDFVWNLKSARCYRQTTNLYGSLHDPLNVIEHNKRAFISRTADPLKNAPAVNASAIGVHSRRELVRIACE